VFKKYEKKYTKLKTDRLNSYIQSIGSIFINWVPIIIFSFYNDKISSGIFATYFKIGLGLLYFINVVDLISAKKLSYYFQIKNKIKLKKTYNEFKLLKIISAVVIFFLSYIFFKIYDHYFNSINIEHTLYLYITLILLCGFFGPLDISFLLFNKEKVLAKNNIFLIISIIIILNLTCQYFGILGSLISFSIILLINYIYKYFILKKLNYV
jgi:O-antigen/teichoic acid export membrane protein